LAGNYNVVVEGANTCEDSAASGTTVTLNALPVVTITPSAATTFCAGNSINLNASTGTAYQWYHNGSLIAGAAGSSLMVNASGGYNVIVTDANNCSDSAASATAIQVNPLPAVNVVGLGPLTFCDGDSVTLNTSGGAGYQWYKNGSLISGQTSTALLVKSTGNYNVWVTDANNCSDSAATATGVTVHALPVVNITPLGPLTFCDGDSAELSVTGGLHHAWTRNGMDLMGDTLASLWVKLQGSYNVRLTDANQCIDSSAVAVEVEVDPLPVVTATSVQPLCNTITNYTLTVGSPAGGYYTGIAVSQDSVFDPQQAGTGVHTLMYHYQDPTTGCEDSVAIDVEVVDCVGIDEVGSNELSIYPNPVNETLYVQFGQTYTNMEISLINMQGQVVLHKAVAAVNAGVPVQVDVHDMVPGVYVVEVRMSGEKQTKKLIIH
jgi:hypothetical protein